MAAIKSYTDLEQSKKLAGILPLESADMMYHSVENEYGSGAFVATSKIITNGLENDNFYYDDIPCWSLSALLNILAKIASKIDDDGSADLSSFMGQWSVNMFDCPVEATDNYDNPIDACVVMIIHLHELNLL